MKVVKCKSQCMAKSNHVYFSPGEFGCFNTGCYLKFGNSDTNYHVYYGIPNELVDKGEICMSREKRNRCGIVFLDKCKVSIINPTKEDDAAMITFIVENSIDNQRIINQISELVNKWNGIFVDRGQIFYIKNSEFIYKLKVSKVISKYNNKEVDKPCRLVDDTKISIVGELKDSIKKDAQKERLKILISQINMEICDFNRIHNDVSNSLRKKFDKIGEYLIAILKD